MTTIQKIISYMTGAWVEIKISSQPSINRSGKYITHKAGTTGTVTGASLDHGDKLIVAFDDGSQDTFYWYEIRRLKTIEPRKDIYQTIG